jgi:hypothetical protein
LKQRPPLPRNVHARHKALSFATGGIGRGRFSL